MKIRKFGNHAYVPVNEDGCMPFFVTEWTTRLRKGKMGKTLKLPYFDMVRFATKRIARDACNQDRDSLVTVIWAKNAKHAREIWELERVIVP